MRSEWLWLWYVCWCQMDLFEYFRTCFFMKFSQTQPSLVSGLFPVFTCAVWVSLSPLRTQIPVLGFPVWNLMCPSVVVAYPPQGLTYCAFWDAFLLTMVVQSGYLSKHSLPVGSFSPMALINKVFMQVYHTGWFFSPFFHTILQQCTMMLSCMILFWIPPPDPQSINTVWCWREQVLVV